MRNDVIWIEDVRQRWLDDEMMRNFFRPFFGDGDVGDVENKFK